MLRNLFYREGFDNPGQMLSMDVAGYRFTIQFWFNLAARDITGATSQTMFFRPAGADRSFNKSATVLSATAGTIYYDVAAGDFQVDGVWELQGFVTDGTFRYRTTPIWRFTVIKPL